MNRARILLLAGCAALCFLAGCAEQQQFKTVEQICLPDTNKAEVMQTSEDVLGQMALDQPRIEEAVAGRKIIKLVVVPGKLVSIVLR